ncbi:hypothetical protein DH86_00002943 [Scytalidium sp. 3C]|nr:hypothetical protein DH86_00002943 [Scytalidium sp. 3C]
METGLQLELNPELSLLVSILRRVNGLTTMRKLAMKSASKT